MDAVGPADVPPHLRGAFSPERWATTIADDEIVVLRDAAMQLLNDGQVLAIELARELKLLEALDERTAGLRALEVLREASEQINTANARFRCALATDPEGDPDDDFDPAA